jgi:hypothetical protein
MAKPALLHLNTGNIPFSGSVDGKILFTACLYIDAAVKVIWSAFTEVASQEDRYTQRITEIVCGIGGSLFIRSLGKETDWNKYCEE